jgi:tRNA (cytidine/uridine-2'-O-)-methyltransferase
MINIALYQPDIPQNTAAIIRLCSCFDVVLEIIEPCGFHLGDKRIKRIAMDYLDKSKIKIYKSYADFLLNKK